MQSVAIERHADLVWSSLNCLNKKRYDFLLQQFGSLEKALEEINEDLLIDLGCKKDNAKRIMNRISEFDSKKEIGILNNLEITLISIEDEKYPDSLRDIPDSPVFLFIRGDIELLKTESIAIVGTRNMTPYGKRAIEHIIPGLVSAGMVTVSGLAMGIDSKVARETINAGGKTIAVLGHGLGDIYPRTNQSLADEIISSGGLLVTEYPICIAPGKYTFPARNRIIAGLSRGTIVAEAASQSGSLITASLALEYGKEVFAIPGQIFDKNMEGTHQIISRGEAKLITCASDVLSEIGIDSSEEKPKNLYKPQTPEEHKILEIITDIPMSIDEIVENLDLNTAQINASLTLMELKGGVKNVGMGMWVKC
jgi:DNA processing protein